MSDTGFLNRILTAVSRGPVRAFRNSVGLGWVGKSRRFDKAETITVRAGDVVVFKARPLHAGLLKGSGDLIGWRSVVIGPEMVGQTVAVFVSLEAKEGTGRSSPDQVNWRTQIQQAGGIAAEVRSVEDAVRAVAGPFRKI